MRVVVDDGERRVGRHEPGDRKSTRLNSSHGYISYAVFCLKKKKTNDRPAKQRLQLLGPDPPHFLRHLHHHEALLHSYLPHLYLILLRSVIAIILVLVPER